MITKQQKKEVLRCLIEAYDKVNDNCSECYDIDCKKSVMYRYLKPKYQIDVIDHKACLKQMKNQAKNLLKLIMLPMFKDVRQKKCEMCNKLMGFRTWKYKWKEMDNGNFTMLIVCKKCGGKNGKKENRSK